MATKQSLPACAVSTLRQTSKKMATETLKKTVPKLSSTAPIRSEVTVKMISLQPTQPDTGSLIIIILINSKKKKSLSNEV